MNYRDYCTVPLELLEQIAAEGLDALPEAIRILVNAAMQIERQQYLSVSPYERSPDRRGHAKGCRPKTISARLGKITCAVPLVCEGGFCPQALEKGTAQRMSFHLGASRTVCPGCLHTQGEGDHWAAALLDEILKAWRQRPLDKIPYLRLDALHEKVREDGQISDTAVLIASGVDLQGKRQMPGVFVPLSEAEIHGRTFLQALAARGLSGIRLIVRDDHAGIGAARGAVLGGIPWHRCQFHL